MKKVVGIDIGYGFLKLEDGETKIKVNGKESPLVIPSVIGDAIELTFEMGSLSKKPSLRNKIKHLNVKYDGSEYFIGNMAIEQSNTPYRSLSSDRNADIVSRLMLLTGLSLLTTNLEQDFIIVTGLPVKDFIHYKKLYEKTFVGKHEITVSGITKNLNVEKVIVVPQPYGTFCDGLFKEDGTLEDDFSKSHVGVIDVGFKTSDFIQVKKYNYLDKFSATSSNGMSIIYKDIQKYLSSKGYEKEDFELEDIIREGYWDTLDGRIDLTEEINKSKKNLVKKIVSEVKSLWKNIPELRYVLISGGGGAFLFEEFMNELGDYITLAPNSQFANVRGYKKWGDYLKKTNNW